MLREGLGGLRNAGALVRTFITFLLCSAVIGDQTRYRDVLPSFRPAKTRRECHVHKCEHRPSDETFTARKCHRRKGHLERMGSQQKSVPNVPRVTMSDPRAFYEKHVAAAEPVVLAGAAAAATGGVAWTDDFLSRRCHLDDAHGGRPWLANVEMSKVVVSSTRGPREKINYCTFLRDYLKPEFKDKMYLIAPLTDPGVQLGKHVEMPAVLQCPEMHESVHETRLWMSSGNTTSELHFDTHDNLMLQVFGTKSIYFFPPSQSHKTYMDYHDRYGDSPVNPERVDLDKWPMFAQLEGGMVAHLRGGDALFIPEGWWHQIRTGPERNAAVTWEFEPYEGIATLWGLLDSFGQDTFEQFRADGLWSSQVL